MINKSNISRVLVVGAAFAGSLLIMGVSQANAQQTRDPFVKPGYMRQPSSQAGGVRTPKSTTPTVSSEAPSIEQRIEYYKRLREQAAANGAPLPKVTSVLTLGEMAVTGIFRTPRGYAAMVEATPIKLSYTIYPGERFFDGQLVAVEENRLVFRRVTKMSNGKFVASVENKPLRSFSTKAVVEGTAPNQGTDRPVEQASTVAPASSDKKDAKPVQIVSPLDEMNKQPQETQKEKSAKPAKKPAKVAKNK